VIPQYPYYLFYIDGTLLDSASDICAAVIAVLSKTPAGPGLQEEGLRRFIGRHLIDMFEELLPSYTQEQHEALMAEYRSIYLAREHSSTHVYPGVIEGLAALGGKKATATTKGTPTTRQVLEKFGLLRYFDYVQGTDGFPSKPAPDVLLRSIEGLGATPRQCLMVGDSAPDMEAGRRAGVKICAVRYGYGDKEEMQRWEPDYWIDDLRELSGT